MTRIRSLFPARSRALTISIALNLFLAGAVSGLWFGAGSAPPPAPEAGYSFAEFVRDLPDETRIRIATALDERQNEVSRRIGALAGARAEVVGALGAEPHDPDRVRRALVRLRETTRDVQAVMHAVVGEVTDGLSPADRARLARSMFATVRGSQNGETLLSEVPLL